MWGLRELAGVRPLGNIPPVVQVAFKEWAVVVDALGRGEQIFVLRKGGIHEGRGGFVVEHSEFLLFPTLFHQQRESVVAAAQRRFDEISPTFPEPGTLRLEYWAQLIEWRRINSLEMLGNLIGQHIWRDDVLRERFDWGTEQGVFGLVLRVFQLPAPLEMPLLPRYGGCRSWVTLDGNVDTSAGRPVLSDNAFQSKLERFRRSVVEFQ